MRDLFLISFAVIFFLSCSKSIEYENTASNHVKQIKAGLKDSLTVGDFASIDFSRSIITKTNNEIRFFRIPFINKKLSEEFVLLQTDTLGKILLGFIIKLNQRININDEDYGYNGTVEISYLNGTTNIISEIKNGYITAFHKRQAARRSLVVPTKTREYYPEVIAAYYSILTNGRIPTYYISLSGLTPGGAESAPNRYSSVDGTGKRESERMEEDDAFEVDFEYIEDLSPIDITKYLRCFSNIADPGSTCSIEIFADIPVDDFPNRIFNYEQGSPGHTFLRMTKTNGSESVTQNIGFYPNATWKMLLTDGVENKIVDNGEHEFNASLKMNITSEQLNNTLNHLKSLANREYDIDDYNCTDFVIEVFNHSRIGNPIEIERTPIPGGRAENTSTPGGLYNKLKSMKRSGIESANINLPETKAFVGKSVGPCN